tara:strand:- start:65782 stop:65967 length:186 start_codon:yes stop_codon:yes gene_type:complete
MSRVLWGVNGPCEVEIDVSEVGLEAAGLLAGSLLELLGPHEPSIVISAGMSVVVKKNFRIG